MPRNGVFAFGTSVCAVGSFADRSPFIPILNRSMPFPDAASSRVAGCVGRFAVEPKPAGSEPAFTTADLFPTVFVEVFPAAGRTFGSTPVNHAGPEPFGDGDFV